MCLPTYIHGWSTDCVVRISRDRLLFDPLSDTARPPVGDLGGLLFPNCDRGCSLTDTMDRVRDAAIRSLARDLRIDPSEAERWCAAWEQFARRHGGARSAYFWDAGRGWIDAQRAMGIVVSLEGPARARVVRSSAASRR